MGSVIFKNFYETSLKRVKRIKQDVGNLCTVLG